MFPAGNRFPPGSLISSGEIDFGPWTGPTDFPRGNRFPPGKMISAVEQRRPISRGEGAKANFLDNRFPPGKLISPVEQRRPFSRGEGDTVNFPTDFPRGK